MDVAVVVGAALLGVLVSPLLLQLVVRVPAMATVGYVSEEDATISPRTRERAVQVLAPVLFAVAALRFGADVVVVPYMFCFAVLLVVSVIDLEHYRIPDRIVFPSLAVSIGADHVRDPDQGGGPRPRAQRADRFGGLLRAAPAAPPRVPEGHGLR